MKKQFGFTLVESLLVILVLAVAGFGGYYVWHTNHKPKTSTVASNTTSPTSSASNVPAAKADSTKSPQTLRGVVGQTIATSNGSLTVNSYLKTSEHSVSSVFTSTSPILKVNVTLKNTSTTTQTYSSGQFSFINSAGVVQSDINDTFSVSDYKNYLSSITLTPGASTTSNLFYDYNSKQGTFQWVNGQTVDVPLAAL